MTIARMLVVVLVLAALQLPVTAGAGGRGFRGAPPADVEAVAKVVTAIGRLMATVPELTEIDVNPLMVHGKGQGVTALDALIVAG